ncbi:MAG: efflux RND transporter periplasmic adaptor subunit [Sulfuricaulis sp.]
MMNTLSLRRLMPILAVVATFSACSDEAAPTANTATSYVAISRGRIDVEGGLLHLSMPSEGTLTNISVHEGDHVNRGQVLAVLDTKPARLAVSAAQARLSQAKAQVALYLAQIATARKRAERLTAAANANAGDRQSADDAKGAVAQLHAELEGARAATRMAEVELREASFALERDTLRAPIEATVVSVAASVGASVSPQSGALFTLLPHRPVIVRAELSEMYVDSVHPGMAASVVNNDDQASIIPAHVARVGVVFGASKLEDDPELRGNERTVECILTFDKPQTLRIGQRVLVRFGTPAKTVQN